MGRLFCLFSVIALGVHAARADTVTLTPDRDNTLISTSAGNLSDGAGDAFYAGRTRQSSFDLQPRRALIHFNFSSIPAGATVTNATLRLVADNRGQNGNRTMTLHRLLQDWGQGTSNSYGVGAIATNNDATWLYRFYNPTNPTSSPKWTIPGGSFSNTNSSSAICPNLGGAFTFPDGAGSVMLSDIQGWLDTPANNFGWEILGDETTQETAKRIFSRETTVVANRPQLTITYAVPEPHILTLIATFSVLALRRRPHRAQERP